MALTADLDETLAQPPEWWQEWASRDGRGRDVIMVADAGDRLVGMTGVHGHKQPKLAHAGDIWGVYVLTDFRSRGLGQSLLGACIAWAKVKGLRSLRLGVETGNNAARRCYERCGFEMCGRDPQVIQWEGKFYDEFLMVLRL